MKELIIVRHARSQYNIGETKKLDSNITKFGETQANNVANFLEKKIDFRGYKFYTSPFLRCLQTSFPIHVRSKGVFEVRSELREYLNHSKNELVFVPNRKQDYPSYDWSNYSVDGKEYSDEFNEIFVNRMWDFYNSLPEKSLVVTHGMPALTLLYIATEKSNVLPIWDSSIDNCSITYVVNGRAIWRGKNLNHEVENFDTKFDFSLARN